MVRGRSFVQTLVALAVLMLAAGPASPAPDTTGTVAIESSVVDVGVSKVFAQGEVYNLEEAEDFEGMFMAGKNRGVLVLGAAAGISTRKFPQIARSESQGLPSSPTGEALPPSMLFPVAALMRNR